jgi:hypothetical protein
VGVRGPPTEFATARSKSVSPEKGAKLAKTHVSPLHAKQFAWAVFLHCLANVVQENGAL